MAEEFGIENLKKFLKFSAKVTESVEAARADGEIDWTDYRHFVDDIPAIMGVVAAAPQLKDEILDLSSDEKKELQTYFKEELDIDNDNLEELIENIVSQVINVASFIDEALEFWGKLRNKEE